MGLDIREQEGIDFTTELIDTIEDYAKKTSTQTGHSFNVEEIPGESVCPRFAKKDKIEFGDRQPFELYSNQYIPVIAEASMPDRISITGKFMDRLSGGGILHLNVSEKMTSPEQMRRLIEYSVSKGVSHFAVNYGFGCCPEGHVTVCGNSNVCPVCGSEIKEWMTRIIGYFTKTTSWNKTRREFEFPRRKFMVVE
jgi:ribonucleoside-triphosphate reductase